ncbi:ABC transporter permease subunit [Streptomyces sp. SID13031]|uniref:ABC transporter permease n=1 Tax=Streptomyces sp. SID13031 TaxID=2706046 RepID=UPI0013C8BDA2|nr:ABC transporter permease subunit [Streptomyces sp. SID13031]NEA35859.1 ABC transporter permease subunit [Streptomyces sp. SID13031]
MKRRLTALLVASWLPVLLLVVWWTASANSTSLFFPPLRDILTETRRLWLFDHFRSDLLPSLATLAMGYTVAVVGGVLIALLLGFLPKVLDAISPELEFVRSMPAVAVLPVAVIMLGLGDLMRVSVIAFGAIWPVLLNTLAAVSGTDPVQRDTERAFGLGVLVRLRIRLGGAVPQILAGARTSLAIAVVLIVVSEMQGSDRGIGNFVLAAQRSFAITEMWTGMVVLGALGYLLNVAFRAVEQLLLRHHPPARGGRAALEAR